MRVPITNRPFSPALSARSSSVTRRARLSSSASASSAVACMVSSGMLVTGMPRAAAADVSIRS